MLPYSSFKGIVGRTGFVAFALMMAVAGSATASSGGAAFSGRTSHGGKRIAKQIDSTGHTYPGDSIHMGDRILHQGLTGHDVRVLQQYLTIVGYPTPIDGDFGPGTKQNLIGFQRAHSMTADGVLTWAINVSLRSAVAAQRGQTSQSTLASATTTTPAPNGQVLADGLAVAPAGAPQVILDIIQAGNQIALDPYVYGGGHGSWDSIGYDCSGSVSFALHAGGLLSRPYDSTDFESYGTPGRGHWITIWTNPGHAYMWIAGLRFDTGAMSSSGGSRWTTASRSNAGFIAVHPTGW